MPFGGRAQDRSSLAVCFMGNRDTFHVVAISFTSTARPLQSGWRSDVSLVPLSSPTPTYGVSRTRTPSVRRENSCSGIGLDTTVIFLCPKKSSLGSGGPRFVQPVCVPRCPVATPTERITSGGRGEQAVPEKSIGKIVWPPTIAAFALSTRNRVVVRSFSFLLLLLPSSSSSVVVGGYMTSDRTVYLGHSQSRFGMSFRAECIASGQDSGSFVAQLLLALRSASGAASVVELVH